VIFSRKHGPRSQKLNWRKENMPKIDYYRTEDPRMHNYLLTVMHTLARHDSKKSSEKLLELEYHKVHSQRGVNYLRKEILSSTYHLGDSTILHLTDLREDDNYIAIAAKTSKVRNRDREELEHLTKVKLTKLEKVVQK
jgi:hypothetical protein